MWRTYDLALGGPDDKRIVGLINGEDERDVFQRASRWVHGICRGKGMDCYYTRVWNMDSSTVFDFGSHSQFFFLTPEVNLEAVLAKEESDGSNQKERLQS